MSGFSPEWLALREPVDHRSRAADVARQLQQHFSGRKSVRVVDLGCGTGSNIRGTFHLLPDRQEWTLVDYDPRLLSAAREALAAWSDRNESADDGLIVHKDGKTLRVSLRQSDLNVALDDALGQDADLVTASAFFDLCSADFIERFAAAVARRRAVFFTVLTYNGQQTWTPAHPADRELRDAFCAHQRGDKGFGPSAGPEAAASLRAAFAGAGYDVREGDSPWVMDMADGSLIADLARGFAGAVAETGVVAPATVAAWQAVTRSGAVVGHTDTLAIPR